VRGKQEPKDWCRSIA